MYIENYLLTGQMKGDTWPPNLNLTATKHTKKYFAASQSLTIGANIHIHMHEKTHKNRAENIYYTH